MRGRTFYRATLLSPPTLRLELFPLSIGRLPRESRGNNLGSKFHAVVNPLSQAKFSSSFSRSSAPAAAAATAVVVVTRHVKHHFRYVAAYRVT